MTKEELVSNLKIDYYRTKGQKITSMDSGIRISCEELNIDICIATHRSRLQNTNIAMFLMELAIDKMLTKNENISS